MAKEATATQKPNFSFAAAPKVDVAIPEAKKASSNVFAQNPFASNDATAAQKPKFSFNPVKKTEEQKAGELKFHATMEKGPMPVKTEAPAQEPA